ncbi:dienelactone hydrolase family protein [Glaciihabitans sp. UYNi722]|uniref:dienelactone hydrolase family protein n=1 Tax=Glaciihabitans sp. UYNi722 TaxID=3156344 RepID=UPI00339680CF
MRGQDFELVGDNGQRIGAYVARPSRLPAPGVIVLQEIFGVNPFIRSVVDKFASQGFIAIAPQLYWRQQKDVQLDSEKDVDQALGFLRNLDEGEALHDAQIALEFLRSSPDCTGKVAAVGYCLGGKLSYLLAARSTIDAGVSYYGTGVHTVLDEATALKAPVMLHVASEDYLCPPAAQKRIVEVLEPLANATVHLYKGAPHGFVRIGKPYYDSAAAELADSRTGDFLRTELDLN